MDNIYTLNYVVEREIARGNKIVTTFVDLKVAFNSVDTGGIRKEFRREGGECEIKGMDYGDVFMRKRRAL